MKTKTCTKCGETKPLSEFPKRPDSRDGYRQQCTACQRQPSIESRLRNVDKVRAKDRTRPRRPPKPGSLAKKSSMYPKQYRSARLARSAIDRGDIIKEPCYICGRDDWVHAHHDDYAKPLNVRWLCAVHHAEWHKLNGKGKNRK